MLNLKKENNELKKHIAKLYNDMQKLEEGQPDAPSWKDFRHIESKLKKYKSDLEVKNKEAKMAIRNCLKISDYITS